MKKTNTKLIFTAVGIALSVAVWVMLIVDKNPEVKTLLMLLAIGTTSQSLAMLDFLGEKKEQDQDGGEE